MLTVLQTVNKFKTPITTYPKMAVIQKVLLRIVLANPPGEDLASLRLLALFQDSDLRPLFLNTIKLPVLSDLSQASIDTLNPLQEVLPQFSDFDDTLRIAVEESKDFLPLITVDLLQRYNTVGAPLERLNVATFIILSANMQE